MLPTGTTAAQRQGLSGATFFRVDDDGPRSERVPVIHRRPGEVARYIELQTAIAP